MKKTICHSSKRPDRETYEKNYEEVIYYFLNNKNNTVKEISKALKLSESVVSEAINKYLDKKIKK